MNDTTEPGWLKAFHTWEQFVIDSWEGRSEFPHTQEIFRAGWEAHEARMSAADRIEFECCGDPGCRCTECPNQRKANELRKSMADWLRAEREVERLTEWLESIVRTYEDGAMAPSLADRAKAALAGGQLPKAINDG